MSYSLQYIHTYRLLFICWLSFVFFYFFIFFFSANTFQKLIEKNVLLPLNKSSCSVWPLQRNFLVLIALVHSSLFPILMHVLFLLSCSLGLQLSYILSFSPVLMHVLSLSLSFLSLSVCNFRTFSLSLHVYINMKLKYFVCHSYFFYMASIFMYAWYA